jgi:uncharacterized protein (DUF2126 family)
MATISELAGHAAARLRSHGIRMTMGGEPSFVPLEPSGSEWSVVADGPTKLRYAYALADALMDWPMRGAAVFYSPGKLYPGELNPRWALHVIARRDGKSLFRSVASAGRVSANAIAALKRELSSRLRIKGGWIRAMDPANEGAQVWVLPLDFERGKWTCGAWPFNARQPLTLLNAEGPAGLRLPLHLLPPDALRRALVLELKPDGLHIFLPPVLQAPFLRLLAAIDAALKAARVGAFFLESQIPSDERGVWTKISLTPDPGVLEVNLPPCDSAREYARWMTVLEKAAREAGLTSTKQLADGRVAGTGGGNHILLGGPDTESNAFFRHPRWVTSILRYWQHHPSLSYMFTGDYVGASSQAPRPDESSRALYDLEMALQFLEKLDDNSDQRWLISETLRHLHTDASGNTHRSEISFDKFWNTAFDGGCRGLIEFRAVETLPRAEWMSAVATLWAALAAMLFERKFSRPLVDHADELHDCFFLPGVLWRDFECVLRDLKRAGFGFDRTIFRDIWEWRFPSMLRFALDGAQLEVRRGCESWPLLCETPLEGGSTSRFVDTSMERLEFSANAALAKSHRILVQGRELTLAALSGGRFSAGLRYRRSALYPSLHPGIAPHIPLFVELRGEDKAHAFKLDAGSCAFTQCDPAGAPRPGRVPCKKLHPSLVTFDLRLR